MTETDRKVAIVTGSPHKVEESRVALQEVMPGFEVIQVPPLIDEGDFSHRASRDHKRPLEIVVMKAFYDRQVAVDMAPDVIDAAQWWQAHGLVGKNGNRAFYSDVVTVVGDQSLEKSNDEGEVIRKAMAQSGRTVFHYIGHTGMELKHSFPYESVGVAVTVSLKKFSEEALRMHIKKTGGYVAHFATAGALSMVRDRDLYAQEKGLSVDIIPDINSPGNRHTIMVVDDWSIFNDEVVGRIKDGMFSEVFRILDSRLKKY